MRTTIPAVIANASAMSALTITRLLGQQGIPIIGVFGIGTSSRRYDLIRSSRYLVESHDFDLTHYEADLVRVLTRVGGAAPRTYPLFMDGDHSMITVSRNRDVLSQYFLFALPPPDMVEALLDKRAFHRLAEANGLPVPATFLPQSPDDALKIASLIRYPCIIKPAWRDGAWNARFGGETKVLLTESPPALIASATDLGALLGNCLIQEVVPGPESNILCSFAYFDEHSEPLGFAQCRKLRQYPLDFGNTSMAEVIWDREVESLTRAVCARLGLTGYISIEFKRDPQDGRLKILEITPGRLNRQGAITALSGVNIAYVWYRHLIGTPITLRQRPTSRKWISEVNELRSVPRYVRQGRLSLGQIVRSYHRLGGLEVASLRDPVPTLLGAAMALRASLRRLGKRVASSATARRVKLYAGRRISRGAQR